jgi:hypothetical protein
MPRGIERRLVEHFIMGGVLGSLLAVTVLAGDSVMAQVIWQGSSPHFTAAAIAGCLTAYCGIGAALSGFLLSVMDG